MRQIEKRFMEGFLSWMELESRKKPNKTILSEAGDPVKQWPKRKSGEKRRKIVPPLLAKKTENRIILI